MLRHKSAIKRARQNKKIRVRSKKLQLEIHKVIKQTIKVNTPEELKKAYSAIDRSVRKGILHRNTAARRKSRLARLVNKASSTPKK